MRPTKDVSPVRLRLAPPDGVPFPIDGPLEVEVGASAQDGHRGRGGH